MTQGTSSTWTQRQTITTPQGHCCRYGNQLIIHRVHLTNQKNHKAGILEKGNWKLVSERISHTYLNFSCARGPIPRPASQKTCATMIPETYVLLAPDLVTNIIVVVTFVGIISAKSTALNECIKLSTCFDVFTWFEGTCLTQERHENIYGWTQPNGPKHPCHEICHTVVFPPQCCDWFRFFIQSSFLQARFLFQQKIINTNLFSFLSSSNIGPSSRLKMWIW